MRSTMGVVSISFPRRLQVSEHVDIYRMGPRKHLLPALLDGRLCTKVIERHARGVLGNRCCLAGMQKVLGTLGEGCWERLILII